MGVFDILPGLGSDDEADGDEQSGDSSAANGEATDGERPADLTPADFRERAETLAGRSDVPTLDFTVESLGPLDDLAAGPSSPVDDNISYGSYLGETLVRAFAAEWVDDDGWEVAVELSDDETTVAVFDAAAMSIANDPVFSKVARRLEANGARPAPSVDDEASESGDGDTPENGRQDHEAADEDTAQISGGADNADSDDGAAVADGDDEDGADAGEDSEDEREGDEGTDAGDGPEPTEDEVHGDEGTGEEPVAEETSQEDHSQESPGQEDHSQESPGQEESGEGERSEDETTEVDDHETPADDEDESVDGSGLAADEPAGVDDGGDSEEAIGDVEAGGESSLDDETDADNRSEITTEADDSDGENEEQPTTSDEPVADTAEVDVAADGVDPAREADADVSGGGGPGDELDIAAETTEPPSEDEGEGVDDEGEVPDESSEEPVDDEPGDEPSAAEGETGETTADRIGDEATAVDDEIEGGEPAEDEAAEVSTDDAATEDETIEDEGVASERTENDETVEEATAIGEIAADIVAEEGTVADSAGADETDSDTADEATDAGGGGDADDNSDAGVDGGDTDGDKDADDDEAGPPGRYTLREAADALADDWPDRDLDFTPQSLPRLDEFIDDQWKGRFDQESLADRTVDHADCSDPLTQVGAYYGEVLIRWLEGEWVDTGDGEGAVAVPDVGEKLERVAVFSVARECLTEESTFAYRYDALVNQLHVDSSSVSDGKPDVYDGDREELTSADVITQFAATAEDLVDEWPDYELDYSPRSLRRLDKLVSGNYADERLNDVPLADETDPVSLVLTARATGLGAYFSVVLVRHRDAQWRITDDVELVIDTADGETTIDPVATAAACLRGERSFASTYRSIAE